VTITKIQNSKVTYKITALAAILLQIQNDTFVYTRDNNKVSK